MSSMFIFSIVGSSYCNRDDCRLSGVGKSRQELIPRESPKAVAMVIFLTFPSFHIHKGILNIFNVFLLASLSVMLHIDKPPQQPMFTIWSDDLFTINKDTLAVEYNGSFPEFFSHEDARRIAEANASDCAASVDMMEMEVVDGQPQFAQTSPSVFSEQPSIQESLLTTINVQRSTCFRYMILIMITLAWALSIFSIQRCTLIMVSSKAAATSQKFGMGIFTRAVYHDGNMLGCLAYPEEALKTFSGAFKASRVFGTIAALLMSLVLVCGVLQLFTTIAKDAIWHAIRGMVSAALIFQTLVFLAFRSNTCQDSDLIECEIGSTGMATIINCLVLSGLVILSCVVPPPANPLFARWRPNHSEDEKGDPEDQGHLYIERGGSKLSAVQEMDEIDVDRASDYDANNVSHEEDRGTEFITVRVEFGPTEKKTIKEITHADGSKTITTTTEQVQDGLGEEESTIASIGHVTDDASLDPDSDTEDVRIFL